MSQNTEIHIQYLDTAVCKGPKVQNVIKSYEIIQICGLVERTLNTELGGDVPEILTLRLCKRSRPTPARLSRREVLVTSWCDAGEQTEKVLEE